MVFIRLVMSNMIKARTQWPPQSTQTAARQIQSSLFTILYHRFFLYNCECDSPIFWILRLCHYEKPTFDVYSLVQYYVPLLFLLFPGLVWPYRFLSSAPNWFQLYWSEAIWICYCFYLAEAIVSGWILFAMRDFNDDTQYPIGFQVKAMPKRYSSKYETLFHNLAFLMLTHSTKLLIGSFLFILLSE